MTQNGSPTGGRRGLPVLPVLAGVATGLIVVAAGWQLVSSGRPQSGPAVPSGPAASVSTNPSRPAASTPGTASAAPTTPDVGWAGTYSGLARQAGAVTPRVWSVTLTFDGDRGTIAYADTASASKTCGGNVTRRPDGTWLEHITSGGCDDGGVWTFTGTPAVVQGSYADPSGGYEVTGAFERAGG